MNLKVFCITYDDSKNNIYFFVCAETSYIHKKNFFKFAHCSVMMQVQLFLLTQYKQQIKKEGMINSCYFYGKGRRIHNAIFRIMNYVCSLPWKHKSWLVYLKQLLIVRVFFLSRKWRFSVFKTYIRIFNFSWWTEGEFGKNTLFFSSSSSTIWNSKHLIWQIIIWTWSNNWKSFNSGFWTKN